MSRLFDHEKLEASVKVPTFYRVAAGAESAWRPDGIYRYTALDTNGSLLIVGW
jgi:hypothetical protein